MKNVLLYAGFVFAFLNCHPVLGITTFNVINTNDAGAGSLRQAILDANSTPNVGGNDIISFASLGAGSFTITLASDLPSPTDPVTIDGYTAVSYVANTPGIGIDGFAHGFLLNSAGAAGSIIRGLAIWSCMEDGIEINNVNDITIVGCWIGLNLTGVVPGAPASNRVNDNGIYLVNSDNNTIGGANVADRNVVAGCIDEGFYITVGSTGNMISGNYIGVLPGGNIDAGNGQRGIRVNASNNNTIGGGAGRGNIISGNANHGIFIEGSTGTVISSNTIGLGSDGATTIRNDVHGIILNNSAATTIGGVSSAERNVISGNGSGGIGSGISIENASNNCVITANYIGTNSAGNASRANIVHGIHIENSTGTRIGGSTIGERNLISGNTFSGINADLSSHNGVVAGNYIGTNAAGMSAIANGLHGVYLTLSNGWTIGGATVAVRNLISGNGNAGGENGISIFNCNNHTIQGNFVGTTYTGLVALANFDSGLSLSASTGNSIGGAAFMERNVFSGNPNFGLFMDNADNNTVQGNYIGLDSTGGAVLPNGAHGVQTQNGSDNNTWQSNFIGGNVQIGLNLLGAVSNFIYGNYIGLGTDGVTDLGNGSIGIRLGSASTSNIIGGTGVNQRNYISGNGDHAILLDGQSPANTVKNNYVGSDVTGMVSVPNTKSGVFMLDESDNNSIGGTLANEGNLLCCSATENGVRIQISNNNVIYGNRLGVNSAGNAAAGFGNAGDGILIGSYWNLGSSSNNNIIGGLGAGEANIITQSGIDGIRIAVWGGSVGTNFNPFIGNKIYCNAGMGINHENNTPDENEGVPAPVITTRTANMVAGTGTPGLRIDIYRNDTGDGGVACDCEGETHIGTTTVDGSGNWTYTHSLGLSAAQADAVTATQTNGTNSTSEFSLCVNPPLPVNFLYFNAKKGSANTVILSWATASEVNNEQFVVERSNGEGFEMIGTVAGNGNSAQEQLYTFSDDAAPLSVLYYRLRQVDLDGQVYYSDVKVVSLNQEYLTITKESNTVWIESFLSHEEEVHYEIISSSGQVVVSSALAVRAGYTKVELPTFFGSPGIYLVRLVTSRTRATYKVDLH